MIHLSMHLTQAIKGEAHVCPPVDRGLHQRCVSASPDQPDHGGWWFLEPLSGNPYVLAALPEDSAASVMVQARLKKGIDVLYGPGAPRCSNKPGGPEQVLIAHCDFNPATGDVLDIVS